MFRFSATKVSTLLDWRRPVELRARADRLHSWLRKSEMLHLAFVNQFLPRTSYIFNRHVGINTMLIEQIDKVCPQSFQ